MEASTAGPSNAPHPHHDSPSCQRPGYLLHKHPGRIHEIDVSFGGARVFFPHATEERCTAALLLDIDPLQLTRRRSDAALEQYVNDRPYVVSSFLSVALGKAFGTALGGRSKERQELADRAIPLRAEMPALPSRGGADVIARLFEPLGYRLEVEPLPLDPTFPAWGDSRYFRVGIEAECRLVDLLRHLYVLIPVLDDRKHYWVDEREIEKLLHRGEGWLASHPDKELIVGRYLRHRAHLTRLALERLTGDEEADVEETRLRRDEEEVALERPLRLNDLRLDTVAAELETLGARTVVDLGCGEGRLIGRLLRSGQFQRVVGLDASVAALETAHRRLHLADASPKLRERVELLHGALTYRDPRLDGFDAAALVEVVEHLDPPRLSALERVVWRFARPRAVVLSSPNREFNTRVPFLPAGELRHKDHRFEWTRAELETWARGVAERFGYGVRFAGIGEPDPELGAPTQMAVFTRDD
jgi:3' terminal RNA ribose 2'-O-methyltransferase Hen1